MLSCDSGFTRSNRDQRLICVNSRSSRTALYLAKLHDSVDVASAQSPRKFDSGELTKSQEAAAAETG